MKVGLIAQDYNPGQTGGTETYFKTLLKGLPKAAQRDRFTALVQPQCLSSLSNNESNLTIESIRQKSFTQKVRGKLSKDFVWDQYSTKDFDVVHFCFQHAEPVSNSRVIVTFNDIQDSYLPDYFTIDEQKLRKQLNLQSIENSEHIIAISEFTKQTLIEKYHVKPDHISVIHIGIDEVFYTQQKRRKATKKPYFFYPAVSWPHKNHLRLLEVFKEFVLEYPEFQLVLSGAKKQAHNQIVAYIQKHKLQNNVKILGFIDYNSLPSLFHNAFALVFPSLFEGFGIPLVEAMATGCPVLCSNTTSLPEIGGKAALYFDPTSKNDMLNAMRTMVRDTSRREQLILNGYKQARLFTKEQMIKQTLQVYKKVAKI